MKASPTQHTSALATFVACAAASSAVAQSRLEGPAARVDAHAAQLETAALRIWDLAEVGYQEIESSRVLQQQLRDAGFAVEAGVAGMPTAFIARYRRGAGPVLAILAEFDALPGLSQTAAAAKEPRAGKSAAHACGHNLFGAASITAAIAVKEWLEAGGATGEIRVYGTPAEEGGSGKVYFVRAGLFQDVDATLHWHAGDRNTAYQPRNLSNLSGKFRFYGVAAHAAQAPEQGRSALDGVEAMSFMVNALREHVPQDTRIHYVITNGGAAPNVVPEFAEVYYYVRHVDPGVARSVMDRVEPRRGRRRARHRYARGVRADRRHLRPAAERHARQAHGCEPARGRPAAMERSRARIRSADPADAHRSVARGERLARDRGLLPSTICSTAPPTSAT